MITRRCGCRDATGKQYPMVSEGASETQKSRACPELIRNTKHGAYGYSLSGGFDPVTGKRIQARENSFPTRQAAQRAANLKRVELDNGTHITRGTETLATYLERWLPSHARTAHGGSGLRPSSLGQYKSVCKELAGTRIGSMKLADIRRRDVQRLFDGMLEAGRGVSTLHKMKIVMLAAFGAAADEELIRDNPASRVRLPREQRATPVVWSESEMATFLDTASTYRLGAVYDLALDTGLRRGELLGLRWADIDLEQRSLRVTHNRVKAADGVHDGDPKTANSKRAISLSARSIGILLAWQLRQDQERAEWGSAWSNTGYVFTLENGEPLTPDAVTRAFTRLVVRAGVTPMHLHNLRVQHATLWVAASGSEAILSQRLGHSVGNNITALYIQRFDGSDREGAEKVSDRIANAIAVHSLCTQGADNEKTGQTRKVNS